MDCNRRREAREKERGDTNSDRNARVARKTVILLPAVGFMRGLAWSAEIRFYTFALIAMVAYALVGFTPIFYALCYFVPGVDLFRRPADATFLIGGLLAIVGGYLVHRVVQEGVPKASARPGIAEAGIIVIVFAVAVGVALRLGHIRDAVKPIAIAAAFIAATGIILVMMQRSDAKRYPVSCC